MTGKNGFLEVAKSIPEKVLEVAAARSCYQTLRGTGSYIIQEFAFSKLNDTIKDSYGITNARKYDGDSRRIDIVIKRNDGKIDTIIEIKRKITANGNYQSSDLSRLSEIKKYFLDKTNQKIVALFAYPLTLNFSSQEELDEEIQSAHEYAAEIFDRKYELIVGEYRVRFPGEEFHFCFSAVCGQI